MSLKLNALNINFIDHENDVYKEYYEMWIDPETNEPQPNYGLLTASQPDILLINCKKEGKDVALFVNRKNLFDLNFIGKKPNSFDLKSCFITIIFEFNRFRHEQNYQILYGTHSDNALSERKIDLAFDNLGFFTFIEPIEGDDEHVIWNCINKDVIAKIILIRES